jgi:CcmD family protein
MQTDPNLAYLFAACTAVWVILFAYIGHLKKRSSSLAEQLRGLSSSTRETTAES